MNTRDLLDTLNRGAPRTGRPFEDGIPFRGKITDGDHECRLVLQENGDPYFRWLNHRYGQKESGVCPKTFDDAAPCADCARTEELYTEGTKDSVKAAQGLAPKVRMWFGAVPIGDTGPSGNPLPEVPHIYELSGASVRDIFERIAQAGGWEGPAPKRKESDDAHAAFAVCVEKGMPLVYSPTGRNLKITVQSRGAPKDYYTFRLVQGPGKEMSFTIPVLRDIFVRVKRMSPSEDARGRASVSGGGPPKNGPG